MAKATFNAFKTIYQVENNKNFVHCMITMKKHTIQTKINLNITISN